MATRQPQQISERVLNKWELLVYRAKMAAERRAIDDPQGSGSGSASNTTVPQTLLQQVNIDAILQTADELAKEDPHVARILTEYAYSLVQNLDPNSEGRGVLQFKTGLLSIIKQRHLIKIGETIDRSHDVRHLQDFYQHYREKNRLDQLEDEDKMRRNSDSYEEDSSTTEQRAETQRKVYLTARILNEVIDARTKGGQAEEPDPELKRIMEEDAKKVKGFKAYNILPLDTPGVANVFEKFPEVDPI